MRYLPIFELEQYCAHLWALFLSSSLTMVVVKHNLLMVCTGFFCLVRFPPFYVDCRYVFLIKIGVGSANIRPRDSRGRCIKTGPAQLKGTIGSRTNHLLVNPNPKGGAGFAYHIGTSQLILNRSAGPDG